MPYRATEEVSEREKPKTELVYLARARDRKLAPGVYEAILAGTVGVFLFSQNHRAAGIALALAGVAFGIWKWRRAPDVAGILFRVENRELIGIARATKKEVVRVRFEQLNNVSLDSKSIRKVDPSNDLATGLTFINSKLSDLDVARIVLDIEGRSTPFRLSDEFLSHMDMVEWAGKIRSFLRSHGWVPDDERTRIDTEEDDDDEEEESEDEQEEEETSSSAR